MMALLLVFSLTPLERGLVEEVNALRENPAAYARHLEQYAKLFRGNVVRRPGQPGLQTVEGVRAVEEAIRALRATKPVPRLQPVDGLSRAARDHVRDQGRKGLVSHRGTDGSDPDDRVSRYAARPTPVGENIAYGPSDPHMVVLQLVIDDGVKDRGHRANLLRPEYRFVGVGCGPHAIYGTMCVMDLASAWREKR